MLLYHWLVNGIVVLLSWNTWSVSSLHTLDNILDVFIQIEGIVVNLQILLLLLYLTSYWHSSLPWGEGSTWPEISASSIYRIRCHYVKRCLSCSACVLSTSCLYHLRVVNRLDKSRVHSDDCTSLKLFLSIRCSTVWHWTTTTSYSALHSWTD